MTDALSEYSQDLLDGTYDCVDRIVLNAYHPRCSSPGGFRQWWRRLKEGAEEPLDNAPLMRLAGRFSRRVQAVAEAHAVPIGACRRGERTHVIAEEYLAAHPDAHGLVLILVSRAVAPVGEVERSPTGTIGNLATKTAYVQHYSVPILDPEWGHLTIKMAGHPPFGAQVILTLTGHEDGACRARKAGLALPKEGNCFTHGEDAAALATIADPLSQPEMLGRLTPVCERWIYSACLCFGLSLEEQDRSGFRYPYAVYQVEDSRNLLFQVGRQMEQVFQGLIDRTRARISVRDLKTIFGAKRRPFRHKAAPAPSMAVAIETPAYDLTLFKLHFGKLPLTG